MVTRAQSRVGLRIAEGLELPADLPTRRAAIVGMSGAGKSNALRTLVERISASSAPFTLVDPLGASWGLRSSKNGKGPGLPVAIFGGYHADVEIGAHHGAALARELFGSGASAIVDLSAFDDEKRARFYTDHVKEMLTLHLRQKRVRAFITDEAQLLAPEQTTSKADFASRSALQQLHTGGRGSGLGCITATQSAAEQSKKTMKQAELFIAMRTFSPLDQKPVVDYLRTTVEKTRAAEVQRTLSSLVDGEAWFISPQWLGRVERHRFFLSDTFDSSRTPEVGETIAEPKVFASVDLARLRSAFAASTSEPTAIESAPAKAARVARPVEPDAAIAELAAARVRIAALESENTELTDATKAARKELESAREVLASIAAAAMRSIPAASSRAGTRVTASGKISAPVPTAERTIPAREIPKAKPSDSPTGLIAGQRRMLEVLARCCGTLTKRQLSTLADVNLRNGTLAVYLRGLAAPEYVTSSSHYVTITERGAAAIDATIRKAPPSTEEIVTMYGTKLNAGARRILDLLVSIYPEEIAKKDASDRTSVNLRNGTFAVYMRSLVNNGLAVMDRSTVAASDTLFLKRGNK